MLILAAPLAAFLVAINPPHHIKHRHHRPAHATHVRRVRRPTGPSAAETALRRRVIRMARLVVLERQAVLLKNFLIAAHTETPLFADDVAHEPAPGIRISATAVFKDLLGSPIIRARVTSARATQETVVLVADVADARGFRGRASSAIVLQPGETRIVELLCPVKLSPLSLIWSIAPL